MAASANGANARRPRPPGPNDAQRSPGKSQPDKRNPLLRPRPWWLSFLLILILNYLLFVSRLVPRPIAVLGLVGYGLFTLAVPLDLLGVLNMNDGLGMLVLAPGFLYEFLVLPLWLIVKGFTTPSSVTESKSPVLATVS